MTPPSNQVPVPVFLKDGKFATFDYNGKIEEVWFDCRLQLSDQCIMKSNYSAPVVPVDIQNYISTHLAPLTAKIALLEGENRRLTTDLNGIVENQKALNQQWDEIIVELKGKDLPHEAFLSKVEELAKREI